MNTKTMALVWRDTNGKMIGWLCGDTMSGTQITAEATMNVRAATWEEVKIDFPEHGGSMKVVDLPFPRIRLGKKGA